MAREGLELCACGKPNAHELDLIHHPEAIDVQQPVLHGPPRTRCAVAPVEGAREEHVLRPDEHTLLLRFEVPVGRRQATQEDVHLALRVEAGTREPALDLPLRLLDEGAHREAENQAAGPGIVLAMHAMPEPRDRDSCGLSEAGWNPDKPIHALWIRRKSCLPSVRLMTGDLDKEAVKRLHLRASPVFCLI